MQTFGQSHAADDRHDDAPRALGGSIMRGLKCQCPACGEGKLFRAFLKPVDHCASCGEEMHHHRADDLPPYLAIFIVGHIVVAGYMFGERVVDWTSWQALAFWIPVTLIMTVASMQPLKGGVIGLQWALRMHGFGGEEDPLDEVPDESRT
ncbi:hypothetical protein GCM10007908_27170 [Rhizobium albus]|jgi:uncharacterized protein (DUF983 family)|nr:hypothetical protein GCM10007908_27170 [Rhizobium albus]